MTNSFEASDLLSLDVCFGALLARSFDHMKGAGCEGFVKFLQRTPKSRIARCDHEDTAHLLRRMAEAKKGVDSQGNRVPELPIVAYYRKPGLTSGDDKTRFYNKTMWNDEMSKAFGLTMLPIAVDYTVSFVASDKLTLDKMQLGWYGFIARAGRVTSRFMVPYRIDGEVIDVSASILDPKTVMFSDTSPARTERKLFSVDMTMTINTQVLMGEAITPITEIEVWGIANDYITDSRAV